MMPKTNVEELHFFTEKCLECFYIVSSMRIKRNRGNVINIMLGRRRAILRNSNEKRNQNVQFLAGAISLCSWTAASKNRNELRRVLSLALSSLELGDVSNVYHLPPENSVMNPLYYFHNYDTFDCNSQLHFHLQFYWIRPEDKMNLRKYCLSHLQEKFREFE